MRKVTTPIPVEGGVAGGALPMSAGTSFHGRRKPNGSACQRRTMAGVQDEAKHAMSAMSPLKSWLIESPSRTGRCRTGCWFGRRGTAGLVQPSPTLALVALRTPVICEGLANGSEQPGLGFEPPGLVFALNYFAGFRVLDPDSMAAAAGEQKQHT
jgi:hypothetical protein